jgi:DNA-binding NarL/FixJ family response regulator
MRIAIVEDDHLQYGRLQENLQTEFQAEVTRVGTAQTFFLALSTLRSKPPNIFIIDVMLPWQTTATAQEPPPEKYRNNRHLGIQCQKWLAEDETTRKIPVVLLTELDRSSIGDDLKDLPANVKYLRKDAGYAALNRVIRQLIRPGDSTTN